MTSKIVLGVFLVIYLSTFGECDRATQRCFKQSDCDVPRECCSKRFLSNEAYCVPRRRLGELCMGGGMDETMENNTYAITCPCEKELSCIKEKYYSETGTLLYQRNPRCREPTYEQPPLEYYLGQNTINTGASSGSYGKAGAIGNSNTGSYANAGGYGNPNVRPLVYPAFGEANSYASSGSNGNPNVKYFNYVNPGSNSNGNSEAYAFEYRRK